VVQLQRHDRGEAVTALGRFLFRYRNALFPCAFALVLLPGPHLFADSVISLGIGAVCAVLGQSIRVLTIGLKYVIRGGRERRVYAGELVTDGLYAHTRNPMYIGNVLILVGIATASNSWACLAVAVPLFVFVFACIVAAEEDYLRREFDAEFDSYCRSVPRWIPRFDRLGRTLVATTFHWRRLLVKEYGTFCGLIGGLSLLGLVHLAQENVLGTHHAHVHAALIVALAFAAALWITVWCSKKTHLVVAD
jgi:protein-S-isoprenylcysteine O-methyltransferase Ste14